MGVEQIKYEDSDGRISVDGGCDLLVVVNTVPKNRIRSQMG